MKGALRYKIRVTAEIEYIEKNAKYWAVVEKAHVKGSDPPRFEEKMGYTPPEDKVSVKEVVVFEQTMDELDLKKLVSVANGVA